MNLTAFRKDIYNLSRQVMENHEELEIAIGDDGDGVVVISMADYRAMKELAYLDSTGQLDIVMERMDNESENDFSVEDAL